MPYGYLTLEEILLWQKYLEAREKNIKGILKNNGRR